MYHRFESDGVNLIKHFQKLIDFPDLFYIYFFINKLSLFIILFKKKMQSWLVPIYYFGLEICDNVPFSGLTISSA